MAAEHFGPYRLESLIGRGGMGEVHRAYDTVRKRTVALKVLTPELASDPSFQARFRAESEMAAALRSAHVIPIHDYGEIDGALFIDMRFVEGRDMGERLTESGPMPPDEAVHVIGQVASALDSAHREGLIHRDIKPSNILLSSADGDGRDFAYLVDFGIARMVDGNNGGLTGTGAVIGSVDYMAPERFEQKASDHRVDVYALACVLSEALTGAKPFPAGSIASSLYHHMHSPPPRPSQMRPGVPTNLDDVVARGMAKNPDERYDTAGELATAARAALAGGPAVQSGAEPTAALPVQSPGHGGVHAWQPGQAPFPPGRQSQSGPQYPGPVPTRSQSGPVYPGQAQYGSPQSRQAAPQYPPYQGYPQQPGPGQARQSHPAPADTRPPSQNRNGMKWLVAGVVAVVVAGGVTAVIANANTGDGTSPGQSGTVRPGAAVAGKQLKVRQLENLPISNATGVAFDPSGTSFFTTGPAERVSGSTGNSYQVEKFDLKDPSKPSGVVALPEDQFVWAMAMSADGKRLFVATAGSAIGSAPKTYELAVVDVVAGAVTKRVPLQSLPQSVAASADGKTAYVGIDNGIAVVDADAGTAVPIPLGGRVQGVALTPDGRQLLAVGSMGVNVLSTSTNASVGTVGLRDDPSGIAITPDGQQALVTTVASNAVATMDVSTRSVVGAAIPVGERPKFVAITPDGQQALVANDRSGDVSVIEMADRSVTKLSVGTNPESITFSKDGKLGLIVTGSQIVRLERVAS